MVEVRKTGVSASPHSAAVRNPVHSPAPLSTAPAAGTRPPPPAPLAPPPPAGTGLRNRFPPGSITVTPVLATPRPSGGGGSSRQIVARPTPAPGTSQIHAVRRLGRPDRGAPHPAAGRAKEGPRRAAGHPADPDAQLTGPDAAVMR